MSPTNESEAASEPPRARFVLTLGAVGAVMLWLAQPPVGWWPLAWLAPAFWIGPAATTPTYRSRDYARVWLSATLYWLLALHWIRLPHPLTPLGWPPLAMYLACYLVATVWLLRAAQRVARVPAWIAAPVAWTAMELVQARLFTGFLMGAVSHSQAGQPWIRSIAAVTGAYGVTFAVVAVAAAIATAARFGRTGRAGVGLALVAGVACVVGAAGELARSTFQPPPDDTTPRPTVALIQGDTRAIWEIDPERNQKIMDRQVALTIEALDSADEAGESIDVLIWPESMFRPPVCTFDGSFDPPLETNQGILRAMEITNDHLRALANRAGGAWMLFGVDRFDQPGESPDEATTALYNSAALVSNGGDITAIYDKTHLVPFGEYIPLASGLSGLYYLTEVPGGLRAGTEPVNMAVPLRDGRELKLCPTICYETVIPHVVRSHVAQLTASGERPDALVNVTNDAWFWGSSELPMHLACGVFRAVETGLPLLIAANGGLSGVIDATGEVVRRTEPMTEAVIVEAIPPRLAEPTPYVRWGDWFAGACLALVSVVLGVTVARRVAGGGTRDTESAA